MAFQSLDGDGMWGTEQSDRGASVLGASTTDSETLQIPAQNAFAIATVAGSTVACVLLLVAITLALVWNDTGRLSGRLLLTLNAANFFYSLSWIMYGVGHLEGMEDRLLFGHNSTGNCAAFAVNSGGLGAITAGHTLLLSTALFVLVRKRVLSRWVEATAHFAVALVGVGVAVACGAACVVRCGECHFSDCPPQCTRVWLVFSYSWVGSLAVPLILAVTLAVYGALLRRERLGMEHTPHRRGGPSSRLQSSGGGSGGGGGGDAQSPVIRSGWQFHFEQELWLSLWGDVKWFPWTLVLLAVVYMLCSWAASKVGAGHRTNVYTNADSTYATVVQICWFVMAVQSVAQVAIYLCSPRVCRRFAGVSLSDVWNRRHGGDQQRSGSAEREPLLQSQSGAASSSIQEPLSREWATPSPPLSSVRTDDYSLSMEGAVGFVPWELGTSPKKQ